MKKIALLLALGVAGIMSANQINIEVEINQDVECNEATLVRHCVGVESDCGAGGVWLACSDAESVPYEQADDMRQVLNEAFCGY